MTFQAVQGERVGWIDSRKESGHSNFLFADERYGSHPFLRRILSLARKLEFQSILIESIREDDSAAYQSETEELSARHSGYRGSEVHRLCFLGTPRDEPPSPDGLLGYAVMRTDRFSDPSLPVHRHVYEAVLRAPRQHANNNFIHCARAHRLTTSLGDLSVPGVLYAQQNSLTKVCAHVSLRTLLSCIRPGEEIQYAEINRHLGITHQPGARVGRADERGRAQGLSITDMEKFCRHKGLSVTKVAHVPAKEAKFNVKRRWRKRRKVAHAPSKGTQLDGDYQRELYGFLESQGPVLVSFQINDSDMHHIIPVIGHTFNEDMWVPEASRKYFASGLSYYPSENWLSAYVVHDDNFGPLYCLPRHYLKQENFRFLLSVQQSPPVKSAPEAEVTALSLLGTLADSLYGVEGPWLNRFCAFANSKLLVLRTLRVNRDAYMRRLDTMTDWQGSRLAPAEKEMIRGLLPATFYMVEASAPELFPASRRKFGEVLMRDDVPTLEDFGFKSFLAARLPSVWAIPTTDRIVPRQSSILGHTPIWQEGADA